MRPQLVIPMSGFGERFRVRGFDVPKPLIPVAGRPIIEHVLEMYPAELDVLFIVNQEHLSDPRYNLESINQVLPVQFFKHQVRFTAMFR